MRVFTKIKKNENVHKTAKLIIYIINAMLYINNIAEKRNWPVCLNGYKTMNHEEMLSETLEGYMHVVTVFSWFIIYSILDWVFETVYCSLTQLKWENCGMLMDPYCPIYGFSAVMDILLCGRFQNF